LGHLFAKSSILYTNGTYTLMNTKTLSSSEFRSLFSTVGVALSHLSDDLWL